MAFPVLNVVGTIVRRIATAIFWTLVAIVLLLEDWLWDPLMRLMQALTRAPILRQLSNLIRRLPPYGAVVLFAVPFLLALPVKFLGLWLIAQGHLTAGLLVFLGAKLAGTALLAWIFSLTKPALMSLSWFARLYGWVNDLRTRLWVWIRSRKEYQIVTQWISVARQRIRVWFLG
jgi:hypothetical protein